jgi:hypothetical protein
VGQTFTMAAADVCGQGALGNGVACAALVFFFSSQETKIEETKMPRRGSNQGPRGNTMDVGTN